MRLKRLLRDDLSGPGGSPKQAAIGRQDFGGSNFGRAPSLEEKNIMLEEKDW